MNNRAASITALALVFSSPASFAQSSPAFDCAKAQHEIERLICQDEALAARDRKLAQVYQKAIEALENIDAGGKEAIETLKTTQRGWIGGRNECWKAGDRRQCALESYDRRTAYLQARYFLVAGKAPVFYACDDSPANEIVATFIPTVPATVRLERGDSMKVGILSPSSDGERYEADFGIYFRVDGDEAEVAWPETQTFNCVVRK